jgi:endonuclease/exonuclease/phosphatase family metal-dependent hydrolase
MRRFKADCNDWDFIIRMKNMKHHSQMFAKSQMQFSSLMHGKSPMHFLFLAIIGVLGPSLSSAQLTIEPASHTFQPVQIHTTSAEKTFTVVNGGEAEISILPGDIRMASQGAQSTSLSVLSYNIWFDSQNWPARFRHMLTEIRELDPDIIGLQEVIQRPQLENQAKSLADSLGYYYYFSSRDAESSETRFGNAILSRYPIEATHWRALNPQNDYRTAVHARINVHGNTVDFYNTHLHNTAVNVHIREEQILDLFDFIDSTHSGGFLFLTGDFNANPDWEEMELVYDRFYDVYPLFHTNHLDPEHGTLNYHLGHQQRRIDYVFFGRARSEMLNPISARVVLDTPGEGGIWGSDHFAVFATFSILSDADAFVLGHIPDELLIQPGESAQVGLSFAPFVTGLHEALLIIGETEVPVSGEGFDARVRLFPWEESFTGIPQGAIPQGWERNSEHWAVTETNVAGGGAPEMTFTGSAATTGDHRLLGPIIEVGKLDSLGLTFRHAVTGPIDNGMQTLRVLHVVDNQAFLLWEIEAREVIGPEEVAITIASRDPGTDEGTMRLAWEVEMANGGTENGETGSWHIDDVALAAFPSLAIEPASFDFGAQQMGLTSEPTEFRLSNAGGGTITLAVGDIRLEGPDQQSFVLSSIQQEMVLSGEEAAFIHVAFHPLSTGEKQALLTVGEKEVALRGDGFDPTITELPWMEDFSGLAGGGIPLGWTSNAVNWGAFNAGNAGGEPPEMVFWWQPETSGRFYLVTPEIITTDMDTLVLSFRHRVRNFGGPGKYTLSVVALAGEEEHLIHAWTDPETIPAEEFSTLLDRSRHGLGNAPFRLAWVFDGTTDNITQWDIDDVLLEVLPEDPRPEIRPETHDFGRQTIDTASEPMYFVLRNAGGGQLGIQATDVRIEGADANAFGLYELPAESTIGPFDSLMIGVVFSPLTEGQKHAELQVLDLAVSLTGLGTLTPPYFIYADFTVADNGRQYTNVEGFREVPAFAMNGSLVATDLDGQGEFGGVVLQLDYNLMLADGFTVYYMWAYPFTDISGYSHLVLYARSVQEITDLKIRLLDTDGVSGNDGAGYTHIDIGTEWERIVLPVDAFHTEDWAENLPDMGRIQRIDLVFEQGKTLPEQTTLYVDLVAFSQEAVSTGDILQKPAFRMYPNPASRHLQLITEPGAQITLFDMAGRVMKRILAEDQQVQLDISSLNKGIYLVRVNGRMGTGTELLSVY